MKVKRRPKRSVRRWQALSALQLGRVILLAAAPWCVACDRVFEFDTPQPDASPDVVEQPASGPTLPTAQGCASDQDCPLSGLRCELQSGRCFDCIVDADCTAPTARCDALHRCVECLVDQDCTAQQTCDRVSRRCQQRCESRADCSPDAHDCDVQRQACVQCDSDRECRELSQPYCAAGGSGCVACRQDEHCSEGQRCDEVEGKCVACRDSRDCSLGSVCELATHTCVE